MGDKTLLVQIFQPFSQYRNPFTFYYAQTYPLPPKSTVIGMLQNACDDWYGNHVGIEKWWSLKVSVHGGFESIFWNYQSMVKGDVELSSKTEFGELSGTTLININQNQKLPLYGEGIKSQRTPVYQQELFNGHIFIFLRGKENLIEDIKSALEKPRKVLSLGRSEDVIFVKDVRYVTQAGRKIRGDLRLAYPTYIKERDKEKNFPIANRKYPIYSVPMRIVFKNNDTPIKAKTEITKETERDVVFEPVIYTGYEYGLIFKNGAEVDAELYDTDTEKFRILDPWGWL
jgi:CRISPR-associated protein Cas5t